MSSESPTFRVVVCCDLGPGIGAGHLMRCLALAEEVVRQGGVVDFLADAQDVPLARTHLEARGLSWQPLGGDNLAERLAERRAAGAAGTLPDVVVIDSYLLPTSAYAEVRSLGVPVVAIVDGDAGLRQADVFLEQNFGAENPTWQIPGHGRHLGGLDYALIRADIRERRPASPTRPAEGDPVRVLAFFGGTDAFGIAPVVARAVIDTGLPCELSLVVARGDVLEEIKSLTPTPGQVFHTLVPTDHLADLIVANDVVLAAAGTSMWELMCLGVAPGYVCVAENQRTAYGDVVAAGLGVGLGILAQLQTDRSTATRAIAELLENEELRENLRATGWQKVDGQGPRRVVDVMRRLAQERLSR